MRLHRLDIYPRDPLNQTGLHVLSLCIPRLIEYLFKWFEDSIRDESFFAPSRKDIGAMLTHILGQRGYPDLLSAKLQKRAYNESFNPSLLTRL